MNTDGVDESQREMFELTAMSLGMDWEEFLFNVLYFGNGQVPNLSSAISNAREETVALHSANNTPYKLRPASDEAIKRLTPETLRTDMLAALDDRDCAICQEIMEVNDQVVFLPTCRHCYHMECLLRWVKLVSFFCFSYYFSPFFRSVFLLQSLSHRLLFSYLFFLFSIFSFLFSAFCFFFLFSVFCLLFFLGFFGSLHLLFTSVFFFFSSPF